MMKISNYLSVCVIMLFVTAGALFAQSDQRISKMPEGNGTISGIIVDRDNHSPLEGAVITFLKAKDSSRVKGAETDAKGTFSAEVPYGMYKLEVSYVGYSITVVNKVAVNPKKPEVALDTIKLKQGTATTDVIEVTSDRSVIEFTPEKKIFNVSETPLSNTGTATDVLKTVPSVTVDNDGNVSLRGSQNVKILIDGRPVTQNTADLLESIPSTSVESVELITNPSARYEAESETGFINIVLKKNSMLGYNGSVTLSAATKDKYNGSVNLSLKNKKVNIYGSASFQLRRMNFNGTSERTNFNEVTSYLLNQTNLSTRRMKSGLGKFGIDYNINEEQVLGFTTTLSYRTSNGNENLLSNVFDNGSVLSNEYNTNTLEDHKGLNFGTSLTYNARFKDPRQELSMQANYSRSSDDETGNLINGFYITNYSPSGTPSFFQNTTQKDKQNLAYFQADYTHPFGKDTKLDAGLKLLYRQNSSDYVSTYLNDTTGSWIYNSAVSNNFEYKEYINAAYLIFQSKIKDFGYNLGLRVEQTYTKGNLVTTGEAFTKKYVDFFPSVSLSQKLGMQNEFQLSYSRRINRPDGHELNPFLDIEDPLNLRKGNPEINPEYIDSYELSYLRYIGSSVLTGSVFFRQTHGLITRNRVLIDSIRTLTTIQNASSAKSYGLELIANSQITKWWNISGNFSYFKTLIDASNIQADLSNNGYSWTTKFITNVKLPAGLDLSLSYYYMSGRPTPSGSIEPLQSMDVSLKKEFLGGKASFSLRGSDVLNTQKFNMSMTNLGYSQVSTRKRDSQNLFLTFTYKFGNIDNEKQKHGLKKKHEENNNENNVPDEEF